MLYSDSKKFGTVPSHPRIAERITRAGSIPGPLLLAPDTKLLRVTTGYFVAGAIWEKTYGVWSCTHTAPILRWMKGMNASQASLALAKMGADYQWITCQKSATTTASPGIPAGVTVKRDNPIPVPTDLLTYEDRQWKRSAPTSRLSGGKSKSSHKPYPVKRSATHTPRFIAHCTSARSP